MRGSIQNARSKVEGKRRLVELRAAVLPAKEIAAGAEPSPVGHRILVFGTAP